MLEAKILLLLLLGLLSDAITFDSTEEEYGSLINHHTPSSSYHDGKNELESSFQYFYPLFNDNYNHKSFHWPLSDFKPLFPFVKPLPHAQPVQPAPPIQPTPTSSQSSSSSSTREWPSWLPPIRLIKLPLDEPPEAIQNNQNSLSLYYDLDDF